MTSHKPNAPQHQHRIHAAAADTSVDSANNGNGNGNGKSGKHQRNGKSVAKDGQRQASIDRANIDGRRIRRLQRRPRAIIAWMTLLICLAVATPAMWINLHTPDIIVESEAHALLTSIDTWTRLNTPETKGENWIEELVPHRNGKQVWLEPPGVTWMQLITFELATTTPTSKPSGTLTVSDDGLLHISELLKQESLAAVDVTDLTLKELDVAVQKQLEPITQMQNVVVQSTWADADAPNAPNTPAAPNEAKIKKKVVPNQKISPGDRIKLTVSYNEPAWRNDVELSSMIEWARHGSLIMALITVAAVFWAGYSIGGLRTGLFSALVCAANPVFIWHARLASPAVHQTMWAMLSIAAAIWAIRPLRPAASIERQFLGWLVCGLTFGAAGLATGPLAVVSVAGPVLLILLLCPNRIGHLIGLLAALLIGVLLVLPWTALLHNHDPDVALKWLAEHQPFGQETVQRFLDDTGYRLMLVLASVLPWTLWLFAAALQPFSTSSTGSRTRLFIGWTWFVTTIVVTLSMEQSKGLGVLLPLVPAGSLVIGQLFRQYSDMADEGRFARLWRWVRWPQLLLLIGASVVVPAMVTWPKPFIDQGWIDKPIFAQNPWPFAIGLMVVLLSILGLSLRFVVTHYPGRALMCWSLWAMTLASVMAFPATQSDTARSVIRPEAQLVGELVGNRPLYVIADANGTTAEITPAFQLYLQKRILPATKEQIRQLTLEKDDEIFVLTGSNQSEPLEQATVAKDLLSTRLRLWRAKKLEKSDDPGATAPDSPM